MRTDKFTILIPAHNSKSTIKNTLDSLKILNQKLIQEIIYIDDSSTDGSLKYVQNYLKNSKFKHQIIENKTPQGLAINYNFGIKNSKSRYLITMHQDIEVTDPKTLEKILDTFNTNLKCALVSSDVIHPVELYKKYNFWMKVNFSRIIGRTTFGFSGGKFDTLDLEKIKIKFREDLFTHSGEDLAFKFTLINNNLDNCPSGVAVIHNHNFDPNYSFFDYLRKENQMNETYGVILRNFGIKYYSFKEIILMIHRLIFLFLLFVPLINILILPLLIFYIFLYSKRAFLNEFKNPKILLVPFANLLVVLFGGLWNIIGFVKGRQTL